MGSVMSIFDFSPVNCKSCHRVIWNGVCQTGFPTKLDVDRLSISEEIYKKVTGVRTYQIHRTSVSFEARLRQGLNIHAKDPIVLASHVCSWSDFNFDLDVPNYFGVQADRVLLPEVAPF
tara:strand:+ start:555 stop:911 length:357 start_codon:yes stop_codon:yes gene_type:complete